MHATDATLPYGVVTNTATEGWAVIHLPSLEVVADRLYPTEDEAMAAAAERRERHDAAARAAMNFDEELTVYEERAGED